MTVTFSHLPPRKLDWEALSSDGVETNGHVQMDYNTEQQAWSTPYFESNPTIPLHGLSTALNYGQQCYEGMKAFRTIAGGISLVQLQHHAKRMQQSAHSVSMPSVPVELFTQCVELAVALNADFVPPLDTSAFLYIRPLMFATGSHIALSPSQAYTFCVFVTPAIPLPRSITLKALVMEDFDRTAPKGNGSKKIGGNYAPVMRYAEVAKAQGYGITLHLDSLTGLQVEEFASCAFIGVRHLKQPTLVIPESRNAIDSATVHCIEDLAHERGWEIERRPVYVSELPSFTEVMAVGTAAGVITIASIAQVSVGKTINYTGESRQCAAALADELRAICRGISEDRFGWLHQVPSMTSSPPRQDKPVC